ncbi:hypothetical protein GXW71_32025 [Roseomonas hellenica]|uniref:YARHG domain-containing protein n=1 Tax=Plastoroseomonas hellenica TaxID=2687306 RepID=A0ABS5F8X9_9PROT|nr:hypothetical protein [Plastoroseomonas hellenica]MBR0669021.1 hypothetical protein [Plastoroseomonas hellenica]
MHWPLLAAAMLAMLQPALLRAQPGPRPWHPQDAREERICRSFGYPPSDPRWPECRRAARRFDADLPGMTQELRAIAEYCRVTRRGILTPAFPECLLAWDDRRSFCDRPPPDLSPEALAGRRRYCGLLGGGGDRVD